MALARIRGTRAAERVRQAREQSPWDFFDV
jgi:hypothetical protein